MKIICLVFLVLSSACDRSPVVQRENRMTHHRAIWEDVKTLDPAAAYDDASLGIISNIYETLYQYSYLKHPYQVEPLLAADMPRFSRDRKTVTIAIRRGIKFQDDKAFAATEGKGRELIAKDFIYAWKRLAVPSIKSPGWWIFRDKVVGMTEFHKRLKKSKDEDVPKAFALPISGLRALDKHTLQIKLRTPYPQLLYSLTMTHTAPVARELVEAYGDKHGNIHDNAVGTGPFYLASWKRGDEIILEKNPAYHPDFYPQDGHSKYERKGLLADSGKRIPFLDRVVTKVLKEPDPAWSKFNEGELDALRLGKTSFRKAIAGSASLKEELIKKGVQLSIEAENSFNYLFFNMRDRTVGKNKYLRQAISSAINRWAFMRVIASGRARTQTTALPPGIPGRPRSPKLKYGYNLARAKQLLKKAGFPDGEGLRTLRLDMPGNGAVERRVGEFIEKQLDQVGIKLKVIYNTFPGFLQKAKQSSLQIAYSRWVLDYPDAENVFQLLYGPNRSPGPNDSNFNHKVMNKLYKRMSTMKPSMARTTLIKQMDGILQEEVPWALMFYRTNYDVSQGWLRNYRTSEVILNRFKYLRIDKQRKKALLAGETTAPTADGEKPAAAGAPPTN